MSSKPTIHFFFQKKETYLNDRTRLKTFILSIFKKHNKKPDYINFIYCSDSFLLGINKKYLKHNTYTDIITFNYSETEVIQSDIYISVDRVRDNARQSGVSIKSELHRVIFHGILHLCGFNDKSKAEKAEIRKKEDFYLQSYFNK